MIKIQAESFTETLKLLTDIILLQYFLIISEISKFSYNSFIKIDVFFFIIMYDSHVLHLYSSHLIRSLNHVNFVFHFMSSIKSTKYRSSSFSTIMNCDDDTCLLIRSSFKNHNRLM